MLHGFKNGICCNYLESYSLGKCIKSFVLFSYMKSPVFYIQYQFTLLDCTQNCPRKKQNPKRKKCPSGFMPGNRTISYKFHQRARTRWWLRIWVIPKMLSQNLYAYVINCNQWDNSQAPNNRLLPLNSYCWSLLVLVMITDYFYRINVGLKCFEFV